MPAVVSLEFTSMQWTRREGKTIGQLVSELLARALHTQKDDAMRRFEWTSRPMRARLDLEDKDTLRRNLKGRWA